jgi:hypothetical protein
MFYQTYGSGQLYVQANEKEYERQGEGRFKQRLATGNDEITIL